VNPLGLIITAIAGFFLLRVSRQSAAVPLLVGSTYMAITDNIGLGPLHFTVIRILVTIGLVRVKLRGERIAGRMNTLDKVMILWAAWAVFSGCFHKDSSQALIYRLGLVYDALGLFFLFRVFIQDIADLMGVAKAVIIYLVPIAVEMLAESATGADRFSLLGTGYPYCAIRAGKVRAQGPFSHAILAGTVAAECLPFALYFWKQNRKLALVGLATTSLMVYLCRSSGPIMTAFFVFLGLGFWIIKERMRLVRWSVLIGFVTLSIVMNAPIYYLLNRINLTGSSDSYHRAFLIDSAIHHLNEWWLVGTDYTRHWTNENGADAGNTDITNYYLRMGVNGGLPLALLFTGILVAAFSSVGKSLRFSQNAPVERQFLIWTLGAILLGHATTFISVTPYDQSVVYFYLLLAVISSVQTAMASQAAEDPESKVSLAADGVAAQPAPSEWPPEAVTDRCIGP
jgi:hypothetical protein